MKESSQYALQELPKWYPFSEYRRRVVEQGKPTSLVVNGDEIGLQLQNKRFTLLATSYDYFDGCQHWIYLLKDGRPVDQLRMPDEFGFIQEVTHLKENEIEFGYFGTNDRWSLVVCEEGYWSYSLAALKMRPNRLLLAKRYVSVRRTKGPPWSLKKAAPNPSIDRTCPGKPGQASHVKRWASVEAT